MIQDQMISADTWLNVLLYYRGAPHQKQAALALFRAIRELPGAACILSEHAEWLEIYRSRDKLVHSFMFPDGQ
jgi:hypothetical protein